MFDQLWDDVKHHIQVQEKEELRVIYHLMLGMESYLEIGASNGTSLWVLGNALKRAPEHKGPGIHVIDLGEDKSRENLKDCARRLTESGRLTKIYWGRSQDIRDTIPPVDCVLIDADHSYEAVRADYEKYGHLAKKLLLFHDIQCGGPFEVFHETGGGLELKVTRPSTMGYGIRWLS